MDFEQGGYDPSQQDQATETKQDTIIASSHPTGTGSNGSVTLTLADTAYPIPATAPTTSYTIILYNGSDTDMFVGYANSNANGIELPSGGRMSFDLGADNSIYAYCGTAGKIVTHIIKEVV